MYVALCLLYRLYASCTAYNPYLPPVPVQIVSLPLIWRDYAWLSVEITNPSLKGFVRVTLGPEKPLFVLHFKSRRKMIFARQESAKLVLLSSSRHFFEFSCFLTFCSSILSTIPFTSGLLVSFLLFNDNGTSTDCNFLNIRPILTRKIMKLPSHNAEPGRTIIF